MKSTVHTDGKEHISCCLGGQNKYETCFAFCEMADNYSTWQWNSQVKWKLAEHEKHILVIKKNRFGTILKYILQVYPNGTHVWK